MLEGRLQIARRAAWALGPNRPKHGATRQQVAKINAGGLRSGQHNIIVVSVIPPHDSSGLLPAGVHAADWDEVEARLATTQWRRQLLGGFRRACEALAAAGCGQVWLDGSFVTTKDVPGDFDACWDPSGVDSRLLDPVLLVFDNGRAAQKAKYLGELFPAVFQAAVGGPAFVDFFQLDKATGNPKGILLIDPRRAR